MIPLSAISHYERGNTSLSINHEGPFITTTISFNLDPKDSLSDGIAEIHAAEAEIRMPTSVHGAASGSALLFASSFASLPFLFLTAIVAIYIVLGILYESLVHPITILSTLPSAGVGALLAADGVAHPVRRDRRHRRDPADRHREEKRHHDGRFRHRREEHRRAWVRATRFTRPACCACGRS